MRYVCAITFVLFFRLFQEEKSRKAEVAQLKLRYDGRVVLIGEEIQSLQAQVGRFKRERDTFRHMLEGAQKTIADLKESPGKARENRTSTASYDEVNGYYVDLTHYPRIINNIIIQLQCSLNG